jgi:hypothetical protein
VTDTVVIHPLALSVTRAYLLTRSEVTAITNKVADTMLTPFPSIRLTELTAVEIIPRVWMRVLIQADCWAATQPAADRLGRVVLGALRASANYTTADAVMGETQDLAVRSEPDTTLTPAQPRAIVTGHVWIRPN